MRWSLPFSLLAIGLSATPSFATPAKIRAAAAAAATAPASGAVVVDASGKHGQYKTVSAGVNALSTTATGTQNLFIYPGVYNEQVLIPARKANLVVQGYTTDSSSYKGNQVNITYHLALSDVSSGDDGTGTVRNHASNTKIYNVNMINTHGRAASNGQALALSANAGNQGYYGVGLYSYQDTLLAETGTQLYAKSRIDGAVDFIFGQHAQAWLDNIDIYTVGAGAVTASGRADSSDTSWYVINNSRINGGAGSSAGTNYLGRPWGDYARVTFQNTYLGSVINSAGWEIWNTGDARTDHVQLEEYNSTGPGASGSRPSWASKISSPRKIQDILGSSYASQFWVDTTYL